MGLGVGGVRIGNNRIRRGGVLGLETIGLGNVRIRE